MERIEVKRELLGTIICAECSILDNGIHVLLTSREYGHVGAVSHMEPEGNLQTIVYPTHKEAVISDVWARKLCEKMNCPVTVCCGIHYEHITKEQIIQVLHCTDLIMNNLLERLENETKYSIIEKIIQKD